MSISLEKCSTNKQEMCQCSVRKNRHLVDLIESNSNLTDLRPIVTHDHNENYHRPMVNHPFMKSANFDSFVSSVCISIDIWFTIRSFHRIIIIDTFAVSFPGQFSLLFQCILSTTIFVLFSLRIIVNIGSNELPLHANFQLSANQSFEFRNKFILLYATSDG